MEKINTPLTVHIEFLKSEIYPSMPIGQKVTLKRAIKNAESLLPKEREVIESAYEAGYDLKPVCLANGKDKICPCTNEVHCQHKYFPNSEDYYNQTFKTESDEDKN